MSSSRWKGVSGIYRIVNAITNDFYIGSSKDIGFRWYRHRWLLNKGAHHNAHLQNAWRKYGPEAFRLEVIVRVMQEQLIETEQSFLDQYLPTYNISRSADRPSGTLGLHWRLSDDVKRRAVETHAGIPKSEAHKASLRVPKSAATRAKMRKPKSEEHRRKLAEGLVKGRETALRNRRERAVR